MSRRKPKRGWFRWGLRLVAVSAVLGGLAPVQAQQTISLVGGGSFRVSTVGGWTQVEIRREGGREILRLERDATVAPVSQPSRVQLIGEIPAAAIILVDTYPSVPGGMSLCQAGEESFLRIISLRRRPAIATLRVKLGSCRDDIELVSPGVD